MKETDSALCVDLDTRRAMVAVLVDHCRTADIIVGSAPAGIAWAAWVANALDLPMAYVRAAPKGYGQTRQIEGASVFKQRVALIADRSAERTRDIALVLHAAGADVFVVDMPMEQSHEGD